MIGAFGRGLRNNEQTSVDVYIFISKRIVNYVL